MAVRVVTDSACDLPSEVCEQLGIEVVPLTIRFGDREYVDRKELTTEAFWQQLETAPVLPETAAPSVGAFEEAFLAIAGDLLHFCERIRDEAARVPAIRESTRQELFRRLLIGREYMHSHGSGPLSLGAVARAACLSQFHFHRGFKQAFQQTPHDYLTGLRLDRARGLFESGSAVFDACLDVGFSSPSAFSRLFRSRFGEVPSNVRRKFARSGSRK